MQIYSNGLTLFCDNLNISTLKHLQFGKHYFYLDVGEQNLKDLLKLVQRNHQSLETFSMPQGALFHGHTTAFLQNFPPLPRAQTFRFFSPLNSDQLLDVARILQQTTSLKIVQLSGDFDENKREGYSDLITILKNSPELKTLKLYFSNNNIIAELISILQSSKTSGIEELSFDTACTPETAYQLGLALGSQKSLRQLAFGPIPGDCSINFFKGLEETGAHGLLTQLVSPRYGKDFSDQTGMKALGLYLEKNYSIRNLRFNTLMNDEAAQALADSLHRRSAPLDLKIYY